MEIQIEGTGGKYADVLRRYRRVLEVPDSVPLHLETLDHGMQSGAPSIALIIEVPAIPEVVVAQTSLKLFQLCAAATFSKYGDQTGGAYMGNFSLGGKRDRVFVYRQLSGLPARHPWQLQILSGVRGAAMTREVLKEAAALTLKAAMKRLEKTGVLDLYFVYVLPDGNVEREDVDGAVVNSPEAKAIQFEHVGRRARELRAEAVLCVSDAWMLDNRAPEHQAVVQAIGIERARRITDALGVVASAKLGLGKAVEVIQVHLDSPGWVYAMVQAYERVGAEKRDIRFVGEPQVFDESDGEARAIGRGRVFQGGAA
jgi:hypothetical protein